MRIKKVGTNDMLADVLTKAVPEATVSKALLGMNFLSSRELTI